MKIAFLIRSLEIGGAERQMVNLAIALNRLSYKVYIAVLYNHGPLKEELLSEGIPIYDFKKLSRWDTWKTIGHLNDFLSKTSPSYLIGYGILPNLLTLIAKFRSKKLKAIWNIRFSKINWEDYDLPVRLLNQFQAKLAVFADLVIVNSWAGKDFALESGYKEENLTVITNGIDTDHYVPNRDERLAFREKYSIKENECLIVLVGRLDRIKGIEDFIKAAKLIGSEVRNMKFMCVGGGIQSYLNQLRSLENEMNLDADIIWTGSYMEMSSVYNGLDILVSASHGEGFSNSIAEAMACNKLCVVTDVGDSKIILGEYGALVPPNQPEALAKAIKSIIKELNSCADDDLSLIRERIVDNYSIKTLTEKTLCQLRRL